MPSPQRSLRLDHREPPHALPQPLLHAPVPPLGHSPRARVPRRHQRGTPYPQPHEQCPRRPAPDPDVAACRTVSRQPIGPRQTRRQWLSRRHAFHRNRLRLCAHMKQTSARQIPTTTLIIAEPPCEISRSGTSRIAPITMATLTNTASTPTAAAGPHSARSIVVRACPIGHSAPADEAVSE